MIFIVSTNESPYEKYINKLIFSLQNHDQMKKIFFLGNKEKTFYFTF